MPDNKQTKPKPGGLYTNNKTAFVDSTLNANKDKEWVQRLYKKNTPKVVLPGEDRPSTHLMGDNGNGYVFPTLVVQPGQSKLTNLGRQAEDYARQTNTGIQFKKKEQGDYFASHNNGNGSYGGYKKGTGVLPEFSEGTKSVKKIKTIKKPNLAPQDATSKTNMYRGGSVGGAVNKGWVGSLRKTVPINAAMYLQDLTGNKMPLTEQDLSKEEIQVLRSTVKRAKYLDPTATSIGKDTYEFGMGGDPDGVAAVKSALKNPTQRISTTIGGGTIKDGNNGTTRVTDSFDFNVNRTKPVSTPRALANIATGVFKSDNSFYDGLLQLSRNFGSTEDGKGIPVDVNIGNMKKPTPYEKENDVYKEGTKNIQMKKKYKLKKAASGLQSVAVPEQGSTSNVLSSSASMAASGAAFGPWGALAGGVIGAGMGLMQKKSQDKANKAAIATNDFMSANRSVNATDPSLVQATQRFKKGGTVKGKMIEIEGKKTPEIHTDKNFNIKNLGTTPHTKGGNKVVAAEGDIVFNTQNSITKFNKIANAIDNGDTKTLKAEQNKLPEDGASKYAQGVKGTTDDEYEKMLKKARVEQAKKDAEYQRSKSYKSNMSADRSMLQGGRGRGIPTPDPVVTKPGTGAPARIPLNNLGQEYKHTLSPFPGKQGILPQAKPTPVKKVVAKKPAVKKAVAKPAPVVQPEVALIPFKPGNDIIDTGSLTAKPSTLNGNAMLSAKSPVTSTVIPTAAVTASTTNPTNSTFNNALQFAGVANNLFQGLKKEKPIKQEYTNPELIKYNDRSASARNNSISTANIQSNNARNLSGGNAGNMRANQQQAALSNLGRQNEIDEREQSRADGIDAQNTMIKNQAANQNVQRRDNYESIMMGNRAAKEAFIGQAASDIGQYGMAKQEEGYMRSRDKLAADTQMAGYNSINGRFQHKSNIDGSTYFEPEASSSITKYGTGGGDKKSTTDINIFGIPKKTRYAKGSKSIKIKK